VICFKNRIRGTVVKFVAAKAPWQGEKPNVDAPFPGRASGLIPEGLGASSVSC
jgi:hypothetical protein